MLLRHLLAKTNAKMSKLTVCVQIKLTPQSVNSTEKK